MKQSYIFIALLQIITINGMEPSQAHIKVEPTSLCKPDQSGPTPLHHAVHNMVVLRELVEHGAPLDAQDIEGNTALHIAAAHKERPAAEYLLSQKAAVNILNNNGLSPLCVAARYCDHLVKLMIEHGAEVNIQEPKTGFTPLHMIYEQKERGITYLDLAIFALLDAGARINIKDATDRIAQAHEEAHIRLAVYAPFERAVMQNDLTAAMKYIEQGIDIHTHNTGHSMLAKLLGYMKQGTQIQINRNNDEHSFLTIAQNCKQAAMVCLLLDHGARPTKVSFKDTANPTTKLLLTHVPKWLIKEHWNRIGMALLCCRQYIIPYAIRKQIVYYATTEAIIDAMTQRAQEFCGLYAQQFDQGMPQPEATDIFFMGPLSYTEMHDPAYRSDKVHQYVPLWIEQINLACIRKSESSK